MAGTQFLCFADYLMYKGKDTYNIKASANVEEVGEVGINFEMTTTDIVRMSFVFLLSFLFPFFTFCILQTKPILNQTCLHKLLRFRIVTALLLQAPDILQIPFLRNH
mgnify:CR=1 FL=1